MREKFLGLVMLILVFIIAPAITGTIETHYKRKGQIVLVDANYIEIEDTQGEIWGYEFDTVPFEVGEKVTMTMFTNYTDDNIYDDEIEKIKKRG